MVVKRINGQDMRRSKILDRDKISNHWNKQPHLEHLMQS